MKYADLADLDEDTRIKVIAQADGDSDKENYRNYRRGRRQSRSVYRETHGVVSSH